MRAGDSGSVSTLASVPGYESHDGKTVQGSKTHRRRRLSLSLSGFDPSLLLWVSSPRSAMSGTLVTIDLDDDLDRWRYTCPNGHRSWEPTNQHFWCSKCSQTWDVDPEFWELRDRKTDEQIHRDRVGLSPNRGSPKSSA